MTVLLVALLDSGLKPHDIAYIKPSTQCVASTLVARFCEDQGIACEHVGPVVYYRGFTRIRNLEPYVGEISIVLTGLFGAEASDCRWSARQTRSYTSPELLLHP